MVDAKDECRAHLVHPALTPPRDDGVVTHTSEEQKEVERRCAELLDDFFKKEDWDTTAEFHVADHQYYLVRGLHHLPEYFTGLDASRPWIVYWILHSIELLGTLKQLPSDLIARCIDFLRRCQHPDGGFGGGPGQAAHLAPTYAAVNALCIIGAERGMEEAFAVIDRPKLQRFIASVKCPDSCGFQVQVGGEIDTRGSYLALAVASLTNIMCPAITEGAAGFLASCQRYEGGFGGEPGNEAHGGYTFCALAALMILNRTDLVNVDAVLRWAAQRQMSFEGGFQGRTNKLVDGCYSFWVGGLFPLISYLKSAPKASTGDASESKETSKEPGEEAGEDWEAPEKTGEAPGEGGSRAKGWLLDQWSLQKYLLACCQAPRGGLKDKPGKGADFYHTCYCISGLSVAQSNGTENADPCVLGWQHNQVRATNCLYNIESGNLHAAMGHFQALEVPVLVL